MSKSKRNRIINHLFSGKTYRKTAELENASVGVISKISKEFLREAEESSIMEAAREYNVEERVNLLLDLSREMKELKVKPTDLLSAVRLARYMKSRGLEASELDDYFKMCDKHRGDLEDFASKATEFYRLEERTGKRYDKVLKEYSNLIEKKTDLRREINELEKKKRCSRKDLNSELRSNNLMRRETPYAAALKKTLNKYGYTVEDTSKILRFLREIESCKGNVDVFFQRAEEAKDLKWEILNLRDEKKHLEPVVESIKREGYHLQNEVEELRKAKASLEIEFDKLKAETKTLDDETKKKSSVLRLTECLTSILKSRPTDVDVLYKYVYWLKETTSGAASHLLEHKPYYEQNIRAIIVNTLLEYLKEDLASREEVTKLQGALEESSQRITFLTSQNKKLKEANEEHRKENKKLKRKVEQLTKDNRELQEQILIDPKIEPQTRKFPF